MKSFILLALAACIAFFACETPAPATTIKSDSIMNSGKPAPDSPGIADTTRS
jgi:lipopolysaccharide export LptBFGC system permease protein LptF